MQDALLVSNVLLWIAVVVLAGLVLALVRQVGVLHERVAPAGALLLGKGPGPGDPAPLQSVTTLDGAPATIGGAATDGRSALLFFLSPTCPVCKELLPAVRSLARQEAARVRLVIVGEGTPEEHAPLVRAHGLEGLEYVLSPVAGIAYQVGKLPFAVLVGADGRVRTKGLVNTREHLESLLEAEDRGVASLQEYARREQARAEAVRS